MSILISYLVIPRRLRGLTLVRFLWIPKTVAVGVLENMLAGWIKSLPWGLPLEWVWGLHVLLIVKGVSISLDLKSIGQDLQSSRGASEVSVASDLVYNLWAGICFYGDGGLESGLASQWLFCTFVVACELFGSNRSLSRVVHFPGSVPQHSRGFLFLMLCSRVYSLLMICAFGYCPSLSIS